MMHLVIVDLVIVDSRLNVGATEPGSGAEPR